MGLLDKLFGGRKKEEAKVLKALENLDNAKTEENDLEGLENVDDLEKQWLQGRSGNGGAEPKGYGEGQGEDEEKEEEEEEGEEKEELSEDDLIASLREIEENVENEEMDLAIKTVMEEMGNVPAKEILELGREVLNDMRRGSK